MCPGDLADDGETESASSVPLVPAAVAAVKPREDEILLPRGDSPAVVRDPDPKDPRGGLDGQRQFLGLPMP